LTQVLANLEKSLHRKPRAVYVLYHNPVLEGHLRDCAWLEPVGSVNQFAVYHNREPSQNPR
jgi:hypothetical protein